GAKLEQSTIAGYATHHEEHPLSRGARGRVRRVPARGVAGQRPADAVDAGRRSPARALPQSRSAAALRRRRLDAPAARLGPVATQATGDPDRLRPLGVRPAGPVELRGERDADL